MKTFYISMVVLFALCFGSCKDNSTNNVDAIKFYPLTVGNYWKYQMIMFDSVGNANYDSTSSPFVIERVTGDTIITGEKWFRLTAVDSINRKTGLVKKLSPSFVFSALYKNGAEGLMLKTDSTYPLVYKYPAINNEIFSDSIKVIATDEITSTLVGNFKCIVYLQKITYQSPNWIYMKTYVSPGYGKVKIEGIISTDKIKFTKVVEYNLKEYKAN